MSQFRKKKLKEKNRFTFKVSKKAKIRVRYNQVPHLTQHTTWESDKNTRKHHIQESQEVSPFSAGDHKAAMNKQESMPHLSCTCKNKPLVCSVGCRAHTGCSAFPFCTPTKSITRLNIKLFYLLNYKYFLYISYLL